MTAPASINETKIFDAHDDMLAFIQSRIKSMPVLFYCSEQTRDYLTTQGQVFVSADISNDDEEEDNDDVLKALDARDSTTEDYKLVVATDPEAMRGVDYRAPSTGITLLVGKSFTNAREAD